MSISAENWLRMKEGDRISQGGRTWWHRGNADEGELPVVLLDLETQGHPIKCVWSENGIMVHGEDRCLFTLDAGDIRWNTAITVGHANTVCQKGKGFDQCKWLMDGSGDPNCAKVAPLQVRQAIEAGHQRYKKDLCSGPPLFHRGEGGA